MSRYAVRLVLTAWLALSAEQMTLGAPLTVEEAPVRTDAYGDPLPPGAVLRLGMARLHRGCVQRAVFSPDGKLLATTADQHTISIWDTESGKAVRRVKVDHHDVQALVFSPDSRYLAVGGWDLTLWDVQSGEEVFRLKDAEFETFVALDFSPDGKLLVSGSSGWNLLGPGVPRRVDSVVQLWEAATGRKVRQLHKQENAFSAVAFTPDGQTVLAAASDCTVRQWHVRTGAELQTSTVQDMAPAPVTFSPDRRALAFRNADGRIILWDLDRDRAIRQFRTESGKVDSLAFSPDGKTLASGARYSSRVQLWEVTTGEERSRVGDLPKAAWLGAFSPDGRTMALCGEDHTVQLWDRAGRREPISLGGHQSGVQSLSVAPDGKLITSASSDGIRLWETATGREIRQWRGHGGQPVESVVFSPDGKLLASGGWDGTICFWQTATGQELQRLNAAGKALFLAFSPDGNLLYGAGLFEIQAWETATGRPVRQLGKLPDSIDSRLRISDGAMAASPDGKVVAVLLDCQLRLWREDLGSEIALPNTFSLVTPPLAFSPDGKTLVTGRYWLDAGSEINGNDLCVWEMATKRERFRLRLGEEKRGPVAFAPDGRTLAVGTATGFQVYDLATGRRLGSFSGHSSRVNQLRYAPDGKTVITASEDTTLLIWDAANLTLPQSLPRNESK